MRNQRSEVRDQIVKLCALGALLLLGGCAAHTERMALSIAPVRGAVVAARDSSARVAKSADAAIAKLHVAQARARRMHYKGIAAPLAEVGEELSNLKQQNAATLDALSEALLKSDVLEKQVARQTGELEKAQGTITRVQEHDAATTASNRKLIFRIMIYRVAVSLFVAWIASKFVPVLLPQFKLYAALGAGVVTLGVLCWFL